MSQLKMYYTVKPAAFPENLKNFTVRRYNGTEQDMLDWAEICRHGLIGQDSDSIEAFHASCTNTEGFYPENLFFVCRDGKPVATIIVLLKTETLGWVHMVGAKPECRGQGVGKLLNDIAAAVLYEKGCKLAGLTTDEFRVPAVKSYLRAGFLPVLHEDDMEERWTNWLTEHNYSNVPALDDDGSFVKTLCPGDNKNKIKLGVFGARRGIGLVQPAVYSDKAYLAAVCDYDESTYKDMSVYACDETKYYKDFDEFLDSGIEAVILANFFNQHAEYAIKALEKGIHVLSETTAAVTMAECVALCRAAEKSNAIYMLAENYAYFPSVSRMTELYAGGTLGDACYAEGEYVHPMSKEEYAHYTPDAKHWRALMPSCYYLTHALAPLMRITDDMPVAVNAKSIYIDSLRQEREGEPIKDVGAIMLCSMKKGSLLRVTGWAKFGGHGTWYRVACAKGSLETLRGDDKSVRIMYNRWEMPEGAEEESYEYKVKTFDSEKAELCGHSGGDYYVTKEFLDCIQNGRKPYFNVYRSCAMAAVAILGWRSSLNGGAEYKLPDFSNEEERKAYENDNLCPFPDKDGNVNYPCTIYDVDKFPGVVK